MTMRTGSEQASWYRTVTRDNIWDIDPKSEYAFRGVLDNSLWRPVAVISPRLMGPAILALSETDTFQELPISYIPHMSPLLHVELPDIPNIPLAKLHPCHTGTTQTEGYEPIIAMPPAKCNKIEAARFVFGEHPDYTGRPGFYIAATRVGSLSLNGADLQILPADEQTIQFFPVPQEL